MVRLISCTEYDGHNEPVFRSLKVFQDVFWNKTLRSCYKYIPKRLRLFHWNIYWIDWFFMKLLINPDNTKSNSEYIILVNYAQDTLQQTNGNHHQIIKWITFLYVSDSSSGYSFISCFLTHTENETQDEQLRRILSKRKSLFLYLYNMNFLSLVIEIREVNQTMHQDRTTSLTGSPQKMGQFIVYL